jgi:uroporphyrinogen-III synthase
MARDLALLGHCAIVDPLLTMEPIACDWASLNDAAALIATSRNGLRALHASGRIGEARLLPLFAVGQGTEEEARALGFADVRAAGGTGEDLVRLIGQAWPKHRPLLHIAGEHRAFPIGPVLGAEGFTVATLSAYAMHASEAFSEAAYQAIASSNLDAVILMSPRTAKIYADLCEKQNLLGQAAAMTAYCLSEAVASRLSGRLAAPVRVACKPSRAALLALFAEPRQKAP